MTRLLVIVVLTMMVCLSYGTTMALASDGLDQATIESFKSDFDLDDRALMFTSESTLSFDYSNYLLLEANDYNNLYGSFSFSSGLERFKFSTFACEKNLIGYGEEGTSVGLLVYTQSDDERIVVDHTVRTLGASGLYSDEVAFAYNQVQYLVVAVKVDDRVYSHVYEVTTKEEATKSLLENFKINFTIEEEEAATMPEFDLSVMTEYEF